MTEVEEMFLQIYPNGRYEDGFELWVRRGHCTLCGKCCEASWRFGYRARGAAGEDPPPMHTSKLSPVQGFGPTPLVGEDWEGFWRYWQWADLGQEHVPCRSYDEETRICIYHDDPDRSEICRKWPIMPSDIEVFPECGFSFEKIEDQVQRGEQ